MPVKVCLRHISLVYNRQFILGLKMFCPSKVIRTRESGNFKLIESGIRKISACGIRKRAQGIRNPAYAWNPESTEKESEIH